MDARFLVSLHIHGAGGIRNDGMVAEVMRRALAASRDHLIVLEGGPRELEPRVAAVFEAIGVVHYR